MISTYFNSGYLVALALRNLIHFELTKIKQADKAPAATPIEKDYKTYGAYMYMDYIAVLLTHGDKHKKFPKIRFCNHVIVVCWQIRPQ